MFENLTSQQKIMFILLGIVALICLVLVLYFALSKKSCPDANKCAPPSLVKFRNTVSGTDIPWMTQTWYKYSYVDSKGNEGEQSDVSTDKIQSPNETDPIIQVIINSPYKIKIYRSVDNNNFKELTEVVVDTNGLFTDTNNPYTPPVIPPKPSSRPSLSSWGGGGGIWMTQTWYKYSYVDSKGNEGEQSDVSTDKIQSPNETDPIIQVIINSPYKIKIYRSVDNNNFKELTEVVVDTNGLFTDTNNPYTPPVIPPKPLVPPSLSSWGGGGGGGLQCPASSTKCTEPCTNSGGCGSDNPWQCTSGGAKGGCAKTNWETVPDCTAYCYIKS